MYPYNFFSSLDVRYSDHYLPVETTRSKESRIKNVRSVGCGNYDYSGIFSKTVHLDEELVKSLLSLVVTAAETCAAKFSNILNFRGFPHIPGQDAVMRYATADGGHEGAVL